MFIPRDRQCFRTTSSSNIDGLYIGLQNDSDLSLSLQCFDAFDWATEVEVPILK